MKYQLGIKYSFFKGGGMDRFIIELARNGGIGTASHLHDLLKRH